MKIFTITDILTKHEITEAKRLYDLHELFGTGSFAAYICDDFIKPKITEINRKLGQENCPKLIAYCIEHIFNQSK